MAGPGRYLAEGMQRSPGAVNCVLIDCLDVHAMTAAEWSSAMLEAEQEVS